MTEQIRAFAKRLGSYFRDYGGWAAVFSSPIFLLALALTGLNYSMWLSAEWIEPAETLIPSLLGFSLGMYAIIFSIINNRLKNALQAVKDRRDVPMLAVVNATFFHFILVQVIALIWALMFRGTALIDLFTVLSRSITGAMSVFFVLYAIGSFVGHLLLVYSVLLTISAALAVYRIAMIKEPEQSEK